MRQWQSEDEEKRLIARVQDGDAQAAGELLAPYRPLLASLARRMNASVSTLSSEELIQAGYVGMLRAAKRYDSGQGARFATYAAHWALGEMKRAMRQMVDVAGTYDRRKRIDEQAEALRADLGRSPGALELAKACDMTPWELVQVLSSNASVSLDADISGGKTQTALEERIAGDEIDMDAVDLRIALDKLDEEARALILLRYFRDRTQKEAALVLGKSQAQVCRIERRALDTLKELLSG